LIEPAFIALVLINYFAFNFTGVFLILSVMKMAQEYYIHISAVKRPSALMLKINLGKQGAHLVLTLPPQFDRYLA
jgi:hypothetical protein